MARALAERNKRRPRFNAGYVDVSQSGLHACRLVSRSQTLTPSEGESDCARLVYRHSRLA